MSFRTSLFLALRYLKPRKSFTTILTALSILGPIIGVSVLVVVVAVMNGFHEELQKRFFSLSSHVVVSKPGGVFEKPDTYVKELKKMGFDATPEVQASSIVQIEDPIASLNVEGKRKDKVIYHSFVGIDPKTDPAVTKIRDKCVITQSGQTLDFRKAYDTLEDGQVICGLRFLLENNLSIGSTIAVHPIGKLEELIQYDEDGGIQVKELDKGYVPIELDVVGAFSFDMYQFDASMSIVTMDQAAEFKGMKWDEADVIKVKTPDPFQYAKYIRQINGNPMFQSLSIQSWRDKHEVFFKTLQTEKVVMTILLGLFVVVSTFTICATLLTIVFQKTHEIGILKAIGADPFSIMTIFSLQGAIIGSIGVALGVLAGLGMVAIRNNFLAFMRDHFPSLFPADLYFFYELPAAVRTYEVGITAACAFALCILSGVIPALMATFIAPGRAIKAE